MLMPKASKQPHAVLPQRGGVRCPKGVGLRGAGYSLAEIGLGVVLLELVKNHLTLPVMAYPLEHQTGGEGSDSDGYHGDRYVLKSV
jgi:hypothetical protein